MFRALAVGLYGDDSRHLEIRAAAVQYVREHTRMFENYIEGGKRAVVQHCDNMSFVEPSSSKPAWGGQVELRAVSCVSSSLLREDAGY